MKKKVTDAGVLTESSLHALARQLGVERRRFVRVVYPPNITGTLPSFFFGAAPLRIQDISVGGLCVIDKFGVLGESIGNEIELRQEWPDGQGFAVPSRIVSRGAHRRNIQFLGLPEDSRVLIEANIQPGICGLAMSLFSSFQDSMGPMVQALEIWHSGFGDSLVFHEDVHKSAELSLMGRSFVIFKNAWPKRKSDLSVDASVSEVKAMILFLSNIPKPSVLVTSTILGLEGMILGVSS